MKRYPSGYVMPWYNGFAPKERRAITPIQNAAIRAGTLVRPTICCICQDDRSDRAQGRDYRYLHTENYATPLVIFPCCKPCHAALHARFADPARWQRLLNQHGRPGEWFTLLSMDPASQWQPFDETYSTPLLAPLATRQLTLNL